MIADVQEKEGEETAADIKSKFGVDSFVRTDVGLVEDIEKMIAPLLNDGIASTTQLMRLV